MELLVPLDSQSPSPLYEQIYQHIKEEVQEGGLAAGSRLPSTRVLAQNLKVSRSTTQMAYDQLQSEGYIEALPCKGYYVCETAALIKLRRVLPETAAKERQEVDRDYKVDFSPRGIDLERFPFNTWRKLSRNTLVNDNKEMFAGGHPQ